MMKVILLLILTLSFSACKKTLPESQVKSLSGKDYKDLNDGLFSEADVSVFKDFMVGQGALIKEYVTVSGGMIFTLSNGDNPYGQELFFYNESTRKWRILADIDQEPYEGSEPLGLKVLGTTLYFTARTKDFGRELYSLDLTTESFVRLTDINTGEDDGIFTLWDGDDDKVPLEVIDDGDVKVYSLGNFDNGAGPTSSLLEYNVTTDTATHMEYTSSVITGINRLYNCSGYIFAFTDGQIYEAESNSTLTSYGSHIGANNFTTLSNVFYYTSNGGTYKITPSTNSQVQLTKSSNVEQLVALGTGLYGTINGDLHTISSADSANPALIDINADTLAADVKDLVIAQGKMCFTALDDTASQSGRFLYCSKGNAPTTKAHFTSYDFDAGSDKDKKVGKVIETSTGIAVAATDSTGSSIFTFIIDASFATGGLVSPIRVMPYNDLIYGYIESNYEVFLSFGNTVMARDNFAIFNSYHGSLSSVATELRFAYEDPNGLSTNGSSYVLPKFKAGNKLVGNYFFNFKSFWTIDLDTKVVTEFELGTIKGEPYQFNGKYYFHVQHQILPEIVEYDPNSNTARHLHPCGQIDTDPGAPEVWVPNFCLADRIIIHEGVGNNLFYTANVNNGLEPPQASGYNLWTVDVTTAIPLAKEYMDMYLLDSRDVIYL